MKIKTCIVAIPLFWTLACFGQFAVSAELGSFLSARESIQTDDLRNHVNVLASDTFEGREAGSRGGRAIGVYLGKELRRLKVLGGGSNKGYYQEFGDGYRNVIGLIPGRDPKLKDEYIVVGAHYDHVGYGTSRNSRGPIGRIHNGADDNASGTAGILEVIEAFTSLGTAPRRSILFAFWDAEEKGLLGSKYWIENPTIRLDQIRFSINIDMIGRLRKNALYVYGTRTAPGLRRLMSRGNHDSDLLLGFQPEMRPDSDHYSFFKHRIPVVMFHTGKHEDYHRPSDDVDRLNIDGIQQVSRLLFEIAYAAAEKPEFPKFRPLRRGETLDRAAYVAEDRFPEKPRLGVTWDNKLSEKRIVQLTTVLTGSAAQRGGLKVGDRILKFAGHPVDQFDDFRLLVLTAKNPVHVVVERNGKSRPIRMDVHLAGEPIEIGIEWRVDEAEPECVILRRVIFGSPAHHAGLRVQDRIYEVGGREFESSEAFRQLITSRKSPIKLLVERDGQLREMELKLITEPDKK